MFMMWLGEQITERGIGNGISILIFAGIVAGLPSAMGGMLDLVRTNAMSIISALFIVLLVIAVTYCVVFVERGERRIRVNYAKRQVGNRMRSEERRVGKECRSGWSPEHQKKKDERG